MSNVSRRTAIQLLVGGALAAGLISQAPAAQAFTNTRYLSADGNDQNPGTELGPWKSLQRVRAAIQSGELQRGDAALLRRGDTFYEPNFNMPTTAGTGKFTLGAYGTGERPIVSGFKVSLAGAWTESSAGVWRLNLTPNSGDYAGNVTAASTNVGFLRVGGDIKGWKKTSLSSLANQWDFYSDSSHVYVKSSFDPGAGVEISVQQDGIRASSHSIIEGLHIIGQGAHGIQVGGANGATVRDCVIEDIGGSQLKSDGTRYGNGIEIYGNASSFLGEFNTIRNTYDVAFTMQGNNGSWTDCHFRNNVIENCNQTFEIWSDGSGSGHVRCSFTDNKCVDAGYSWADGIRSDKNGTGTHLLTYTLALPVDIEITRNQFLGASDNYLRSSQPGREPHPGLNMHHNTIKLGAGKKIAFEQSETIEQHEAWVARTGKEQGSTFAVLATGQCRP